MVFWRDKSLWAVRFDPGRLERIGDEVVVVEGVRVAPNGRASYGWSLDGALTYVPASEPPGRMLTWVNRGDLKETPLDAHPGPYTRPELSADGKRVLLTRVGRSTEDIYLYDIDRRMTVPLSNEPFSEMGAIWWPGGDRIVFASRRAGPFGLYTRASDGSGAIEALGGGGGLPVAWMPDRRRLIYEEQGALQIFSLDTRKTEPLLSQPGVQFYGARVSPNRKWLVYQSTEQGGRPEVFVRPLEAPHTALSRVSPDGGTDPRWSADGTEIFYRKGPAVMRAAVIAGANFATGTPIPLIDGAYAPGYDVDSTGRRFLMIKEPPAAASAERLIVVLNWFAELKRLLPPR
jgi:Tol biopolymer transport system component